jgi:hypothetical protein
MCFSILRVPTHVTPCWCYDRMWGAVEFIPDFMHCLRHQFPWPLIYTWILYYHIGHKHCVQTDPAKNVWTRAYLIPERNRTVRRQEEGKNSVYLFVFCMNLGEINALLTISCCQMKHFGYVVTFLVIFIHQSFLQYISFHSMWAIQRETERIRGWGKADHLIVY